MKPVLPTYVLVANRSTASLYQTQGPNTAPTLVQTFEHPEGRLKSIDINSDRPGRGFDRTGGGRHAMSREEDPIERIAREFALQLAGYLERARGQNEFDQLGIIAPPRMLGYLREALSKQTRALVYGELSKDLGEPRPTELIPYLDQLAHQ
jgi:protein required for attachment to host cells